MMVQGEKRTPEQGHGDTERRWVRLRARGLGCILTWVSEVLHLPLVSGEVSDSGRFPAPVEEGGEWSRVLGMLKIPSPHGKPHVWHT